jgi:hypothetical protein
MTFGLELTRSGKPLESPTAMAVVFGSRPKKSYCRANDTARQTGIESEGIVMNTLPFSAGRISNSVRWIARVTGLGIVGLVVLFFIGTDGFNPAKLSPVESVQMLFFLTFCFGLLVAWRWELIGAGMATAAILCFFMVNLMKTGAFPRGWVWMLMPLPGLFLLLCWLVDKRAFLTRGSLGKPRTQP